MTKRKYNNVIYSSKKQKTNDVNDIIIYARISSNIQTLDSQINECKNYCNNNNYNVIETITETISAKDINNQKKLLNIINNNSNIYLLVYSIDRFSRNLLQGLKLLNKMEKKNIKLLSVTDNISLNTASDRHSLRVRLSAAQLESELLSERTKRGINYRRLNGMYIGRVPYGYNKDKTENIEEQYIKDFICTQTNKYTNVVSFTKKVFKLLEKLNKPKDHFVPVIFEENNKKVESIYMYYGNIADILNDYNILKRNKYWTSSMVYNVKNSNIYVYTNKDIIDITIHKLRLNK